MITLGSVSPCLKMDRIIVFNIDLGSLLRSNFVLSV